MKIENALIALTVPGTVESAKKNALLLEIQKTLREQGISAEFVDTVAGWGCLNQSWLEFRADIETSWGWCVILPLVGLQPDEGDSSNYLQELLHSGKVLMMVHYENKNGELEPHC